MPASALALIGRTNRFKRARTSRLPPLSSPVIAHSTMAAVEDGEILEPDNDQVIDLCSDGEPSPPPPYPSHHLPSMPTGKPAPPAFRHNAYTGGDPFLCVPYAPEHPTSRSAQFAQPQPSHLSSAFRQNHNATAILKDVHMHSTAPTPSHQLVFRPESYPANTSIPSATEHPSEPANQLVHSPPFPIAPNYSLQEHSIHPSSSVIPSQEPTWSHSAPPTSSPYAFHPILPAQYNPPQPNPPSETPVYHPDAAPPPSLYALHSPPLQPPNPDPRSTSFDMHCTPGDMAYHIQGSQPTTFYNPEAYQPNFAVREQLDPKPAAVNMSDMFSNPVPPYHDDIRFDKSFRHRARQTHPENLTKQRTHAENLLSIENAGHYMASNQAVLYDRPTENTRHRYRPDELLAERKTRGRTPGVNGNMTSLSDEENQAMRSYGNSCIDIGVLSDQKNDTGMYRLPAYKEKLEVRLQPSSPAPLEESSEGEIRSSHSASPIVSTATAPEGTPSPPSTIKRKAPNFDAKKHLSELRKKALMSVKKRSAPRSRVNAVQTPPGTPKRPVPDSTQVGPLEFPNGMPNESYRKRASGVASLVVTLDEARKPSPQPASSVENSLDASTVQIVIGGVQRTMTRKEYNEWQAWPYKNTVLVELSDSSDGSDDESDADDETKQENRNSPHRDRKQEIETMKIRMVRLGKCPSILYGQSKSSIENSKPRSPPSERKAEILTPVRTEKKIIAADSPNATPVQEESADIVERMEVSDDPPNKDQEASPQAVLARELSKPVGEEDHPIPTSEKNSNMRAVSSPRLDSSPSSPSSPDSMKSPRLSEAVKKQGDISSDLMSVKSDGTEKGSTEELQALQSVTRLPAENSIAELKRRIDALAKTRDVQKQQLSKRQKTENHEQVVAKKGHSLQLQSNGVQQKEANGKSVFRNLNQPKRNPTGRRAVQGEKGGSQKNSRRARKRYYTSDVSQLLSKPIVDAVEADQTTDNFDGDRNSGDQAETAALAQGKWNENKDTANAARSPDVHAHRGYIDDLKLELEQKKKQLSDERDRTEQLRTADVALAEAQAKLNFKRSRVSCLQDELCRAEEEVLDAVKEYDQRARVIAELRPGGDDSDTSSSLTTSGQDTRIRRPSLTGAGCASDPTPRGRNTADKFEEKQMTREDDDEQDIILRPSPYSPSIGDNFTSCLRGLRSYILRIPHHSVALDRNVGNLLSLTWRGNLDPMKAICPQELRGQCSNKTCEYQHLKIFKSPKDQALQVILLIESFFSGEDKKKVEKSIVNARIAVHEGKEATTALFPLVSTLCDSPKAMPYSCAAN